MKKIRNLGVSALMLMGGANLAFATGDDPTLDGVTTFDNLAITAVKISNEPNVVWSRHLGMNSAMAVLPLGFGIGSGVNGSFNAGIDENNEIATLLIDPDINSNISEAPYVSGMLFVFSGPTGSFTFNYIVDSSPFFTPPFPTEGGIMFSNNIIAASASALASGAKVNTEIGSVLIYNTTTKTVDTIDDVVVSLTRL